LWQARAHPEVTGTQAETSVAAAMVAAGVVSRG